MLKGVVVLVVEDEPIIRALAVDALEFEGFEVLEAGTGDHAVSVLQARPDIEAVVTDVEMPGAIDGLQLASIAHAMRPELAVVIVSGRLRPGFTATAPQARFLSKPYRISALTTVIGDLLSSRSARH
jgi:two-component system, response regulator PdtaR